MCSRVCVACSFVACSRPCVLSWVEILVDVPSPRQAGISHQVGGRGMGGAGVGVRNQPGSDVRCWGCAVLSALPSGAKVQNHCDQIMWLHPHDAADRRVAQRPKPPAAAVAPSRDISARGTTQQRPTPRPTAASPPAAIAAVERPLRAVEGPFDSGRSGERSMRPPDPASLPEAMKYPQCATAVPLPSRFDTMLVPASARAPAQDLRRAASGGLCGYNGFGLASRAPNMLVLPQKQAHVPLPVTERLTSAREARGAGHGGAGSSRGGAGKAEVCYAAGRLAVLADADSHAQRAFEGHTQLVTCMAMHPNGMQVASAQQGSGTHGTVAYASIWDVATLRELTRVGWSHAADGGAGTGGRMTACFERSICALAFSPDGALLLAVGTSSGDQHMLCAFETASGKLVARSVVMIARPVGVFGLLVGKALPHRMTKAQAAQHAKALADEAANSGRAAARQGGDGARAAADAAKKRAEAAAEAAQRTTATAADNAALLVVAVGAAPAPKFSLLAPEAGGGWALRPWKLGLYGGGGGGGGAPPPPAPRACTSALFGGAGFPSPLGSPCGLTLCGTGDGRVFFFDLVASAAALGSVDAHQGSAVSALCLVGSAGFASGGLDGKVHLWERRDAPPPAAARDPNAPLSAGQAAAPKLVRVHTYATRQKLKEPRPAGGGGGGRRRESGGGGSDSDSDAEDRDAQPATSAAAAATALLSGGRGRGPPGEGGGPPGEGAAAQVGVLRPGGGRAGGGPPPRQPAVERRARRARVRPCRSQPPATRCPHCRSVRARALSVRSRCSPRARPRAQAARRRCSSLGVAPSFPCTAATRSQAPGSSRWARVSRPSTPCAAWGASPRTRQASRTMSWRVAWRPSTRRQPPARLPSPRSSSARREARSGWWGLRGRKR